MSHADARQIVHILQIISALLGVIATKSVYDVFAGR